MKKVLIFISAALLLGFTVSVANATPYEFEDTLIFNEQLTAGDPFYYSHDINDSVDFESGDVVTDAALALTFNDNDGDSFRLCWSSGNLVLSDTQEFVLVGFDYDSGHWERINYLGEVDSGKYDLVVGADYLNDDGILDVGIGVWNFAGSGDVWLESSVLSGHADGLGDPGTLDSLNTNGTNHSLPVPEPSTALLLGSGLLALVSLGAKKLRIR